MRLFRLSVLALVSAAVLLAACGGSSDAVGSATDAQPQTGNSTFVSGEFAGIPRPPAAETLGKLTTKDNVTTQSYSINGFTPERVLEYYNGELTAKGWTTVQDPHAIGTTDWKGTWTDDTGRRLEVSASPLLSRDDPGSKNSQFSLVLHGA